jgi:hypothetical protein
MKSVLTAHQKDEIRKSFIKGNFSVENEIDKLVNEGFDENTSKNLIVRVLKEYRYELFQHKLIQNKNEEKKKLSWFVSLMATVAGPVFSVSNILWYILACVIAGAAGYYGHVKKPFAGMAGSLSLVILFPLTYVFYMSGRSSYISIELVIPLLMAIVPAYLIQMVVSKLLYTEDELKLD